MAGLASLALLAGCTGGSPRPSGSTGSHAGPASSTQPARSMTKAGMRARSVERENAKKGSTGWKLPKHQTGKIAGYANHTSAKRGQKVTLYVSTDAPRYRVQAYRMGYYGGAGARRVWTSAREKGHTQPKCPVTHKTHMVSCDNWKPSLTMRITRAFPQGDYLLELAGSAGQASWVPLTVWDPSSHATYLVKNDVQTWQAWNPYGGYDFYTGKGHCPPDVYPICSRARVVSFDRPYGNQHGASDFYTLELPLVRWAEKHGLDVGYATDITLAQHPGFARDHKALLSLGHDECWDLRERKAADTAHKHGVNLAFFAASGVLRHVRLEKSPLGPDRQEVDYRDSSEDPLNGKGKPREVTGNTWASPPANWSETPLVGESYNGFLEPHAKHAGLTVTDSAAWIFARTGLHDGQTVPGVIASDVDSLQPGGNHPKNVQVLAHSALDTHHGQARSRAGEKFYSDMSYYTDPKGKAGVWDSGTNQWIPDLKPCPTGHSCPAKTVGRITGNLMHAFGAGPSGTAHPSKPNWRKIYHR